MNADKSDKSEEIDKVEAKTGAEILVNGEPRPLSKPVILGELLKELSFTTKALAVEVNLELVPRAQHNEFEIKPGDELEIVTLAGGG